MKRLLALAALLALLFPAVASAASLALVNAQQCDNPQVCADINQSVIPAINSGITPNSMGAFANNRNYLRNGAMAVNQQGTATITGGTTSITALQFAADRYFIDTNVSSGAGQAAVITASPAPPPGFQQSVKMWRNSGALLQPVCTLHEIENAEAVQLQGQSVIFSAYVQPLAGFTATTPIGLYVITGTTADQGLGTLTASPAITPAWAGIAGGTGTGLAAGSGSPSFTLGTTAVWNRIYTVPTAIPTNAAEVGVELCFTPVGSASGATDGLAYTGLQLEVVPANALTPSPFEFKPLLLDLQQAQRFFFQQNEPANGAALPWNGLATGASTTQWVVPLPVQMRGTTPVVAIPTTGTFKTNIAGTPTTWASPTAGVCGVFACTITGANTNTAGQAEQVTGGGGAGVVTVRNDVIM